jgi:four helix bundle suffix protein
MVQAARSGRQNIAEGSRASGASSQSELRLVNVARASLEELLLDYEDYLRHRGHRLWALDAPEALAVRQVPQKAKKDRTDLTDLSDRERWQLYAPWLEHKDPAVRANAVICLVHQANYLLDRQVLGLEKAFVEGGGYSEQLAAARLAERERRRGDRSYRTDRSGKGGPPGSGGVTDGISPAQALGGTNTPKPADLIPACPDCQKPMVLRTAKNGKNQGGKFWGCSGYPKCRGTVKA